MADSEPDKRPAASSVVAEARTWRSDPDPDKRPVASAGRGYDLPHKDEMLTVLEAFDALNAFADAFWRRGGQPDGDALDIASWTSRLNWTDGWPSDPAMWEDWLDAIRESRRAKALQVPR